MKQLTMLLLAGLASANALAQETPAERNRFGVFVHADSLDRGYDGWHGVRIELGNEARGVAGGHVALFNEHRFGSDDQGIELGAALPLGQGWTLLPQVTFAPGADFLARTSADLRATRELGGGWVASGGVGHSRYRDASVNRLGAGVERYVGDWRLGYGATASRLGGNTGIGHDLRAARAYGDDSEVGLQVNAGREPTVLAGQVVQTQVRGAGLFGRHAIDADWLLWWNAGVVRQGDFYTRRSVGLGLQYRF